MTAGVTKAGAAPITQQAPTPQTALSSTFNAVAAAVSGFAGVYVTQLLFDNTLETRPQRIFFATTITAATHQLLQQASRITQLTEQIAAQPAPRDTAPPPAARVVGTKEIERPTDQNRELTRELSTLEAQRNPEHQLRAVKLKSANEEIARLSEEVKNLQIQTEKNLYLNRELKKTEDRLEESSKKAEKANKQLQTAQEELEGLRQELIKLQTSASAAAPPKEDPKEKVNPDCDTEAAKKASTAQFSVDLLEINKNLNAKITELDGQIINLLLEHTGTIAKKNNELASKTRAFEAQSAGQRVRIEVLEEQAKKLKQEHAEAVVALKESLGLQVTKLGETNRELQLKTLQLTRELGDVNEKSAQADSAAHHEAQDATAALEVKLSVVQQELDRSKVDKEALEEQLTNLKAELNIAQIQESDIDSITTEHEAELAAINAEKETLQNQVDGLETNVQESHQKIINLEAAIHALEVEKKDTRDEDQDNKTLLDEIATEFDTLTEKHTDLEEAYSELHEGLAKEQDELNIAKSEIDSLTKTRGSLREQLAEKEATLTALTAEKDGLAKRVKDGQEQIKATTAQLAEAKKRISALEANISEYEASLGDARPSS